MAQSYSQKHAIQAVQHQHDAPVVADMRDALHEQESGQERRCYNSLLSRVAVQRDRAAFVELFDHFAPRIKGYLMQGGFPEGEAEEVAQDTMLQVWQKASYFNPERAAASTWIYTIARNKKIDRLRKHKPIMLDMDYLMESGQEEELADPQANRPDADLDQRRLTDRLTDAIQELPEDQAVLVRKAFFDDMSHSDIASNMRLPLGTVKSRLRAGLAKLRKALLRDDDGQGEKRDDKIFENGL